MAAKLMAKKSKGSNKDFKKPVYKKKKKEPVVPISTTERAQKDTSFKPTVVQPSEKYLKTLRYIKKKKYFIDAQFGTRVFWESIMEFHVDRKDIPVLLCDAKYRNKKGDLVNERKVYRIVRYNEKEIVGIVSANINPWMAKTVDVSILEKEEKENEVKRVNRNNKGTRSPRPNNNKKNV
jgi:hypothetical protein